MHRTEHTKTGHRTTSHSSASISTSTTGSLSSQSSVYPYMSPPPSPPPPSDYVGSSSTIGSDALIATRNPVPLLRKHRVHDLETQFEVPETGYYHWKNPNYKHTPAVAYEMLRPSGSMVPTEIIGSDGYSVAPSQRSASPVPTVRPRSPPPQLGPSTSGDILQGLGAMFSLGGQVEDVHDEVGYATSGARTKYDSFDGVATIDGRWQQVPRLEFLARKWIPVPVVESGVQLLDILTVMFSAASTHFWKFLNAIWTVAPLFAVCFVASIAAGYVMKYYL